MSSLNNEQYLEVVKLINKMMPLSTLSHGVIEAFDAEKQLVKLILEPSGTETGWCRVLQGCFCDITGTEVLAATVKGIGTEEYVMIGIID